MTSRTRRIVSPWLLSGLCFFIAFLHPVFWWFGIAAFFVHALISAPTPLSVWWGSVFVGTLKAAGGTVWFWHTYPLQGIGIESAGAQLVILFVCWAYVALSIGVGMGVIGIGVYLLAKKIGWLCMFPVVFVIGEVLGSFLFSLSSLGPGSVLGVHFTYGYAGYLIGQLGMFRSVAEVFGVYGLSFVAALCGVLIYLVCEQRLRGAGMIALASALVIAAFGLLGMLDANRLSMEHTRLLAIETWFPSDSSSTYDRQMEKTVAVTEAVFAALAHDPDIILLPEDSRFTSAFKTPEETLRALLESATSSTIVVDTGRWTNEYGETVLRAFYYDLERETITTLDKRYLVPQGEFVPYFTLVLARAFGIEMPTDDLSYRIGRDDGRVLPSNYPGVLFCSESVSPAIASLVANESELDFVLHPVSHAWFHGSDLLGRTQDTILSVQAQWIGKTIVSAGNMTDGNVYRPDGSVVKGAVMETSSSWRLVEYEL